MNRWSRRTGIGVVLSLLAAAQVVGAGQVVAPGDREWAQGALREEKALGAAPSPNAVAVLYFQNRTGQPSLDPLQKGIALMLITDLAEVERLQVVERVRLQALLEELGLGTSGLVEPGSAPRVGKLLRARWLVGGEIREGPPAALRLESSILDVPQGRPTAQPAAEGVLDDLFRIEKDLLFGVLKTLEVQLTPEQEARLRVPCSRTTSALLALSRAVDASDAARYEEAARFYEEALRQDPGVCVAGDALRELKSRGLLRPRVEARELLRSLRDGTSLSNELTTKDQFRRRAPPGEAPTSTDVNVVFP